MGRWDVFSRFILPFFLKIAEIFVTLQFNIQNMAEFEVTGISYQIGRGLPREEATAAANRFIIEHLKPGTPLLLVAEPTNTHDENAIAVYLDYTRQIGYVKSTCCLEVKPLLDEDGQCDAVVTGNDGWITLFVEIPDAPQSAPSVAKPRVLPVNPLEEVLRMNYTDEERALQAVAPRLSKLVPTEQNAALLLAMTERYMPLSHLSICYEDNLWRDHILKNLRRAARLKLEPELKRALEQQRDLLADVEADQTRTSDRPKLRLMEAQMEKLAEMAAGDDGLMASFEYHIATSGRSVKEELAKLEGWFRAMPKLKLRDYRNYEKLSEGLSYQRVSRKELYEVYASIIILNRYTREDGSASQDFAVIKAYVGRVKPLLSAEWTEEAYDRLWDDVLALPSVKAVAMRVGKQQGTTFNRNLTAHILHTMMDRGVFSVKATNQAMAEALEGTRDHSVRDAVGKSPEDRAMKSAVEKLIADRKK